MAQLNTGVAKLRNATVVQTTLNTLAMLAFAFSALTNFRWIGLGFGALALLILAYLFVRRGPGGFVSVQLLVLGGFLVNFDSQQHSHLADGLLIITGVIVMAMLLNQATIGRLTARMTIGVAHLPGGNVSAVPLVAPTVLFATSTGIVLLVGVSAAFTAPAWPVAVLALIEAGVTIAIVIQMVRGRHRAALAPAIIRKALEHYKPEFAIYFSAPAGNEYHVNMWLPYLERIGRPFVVVLRESHTFRAIAELTNAPVITCKSVAEVDNVIVPTLRAAFYVNNGMKNAHMVRFHELTHIQLLHGDSDKASSYNPVTAMFDRIYVAGQAGIDRYTANNVYIDPEKFVIVGRPQVEKITVARQPIRKISAKTVVYATTWSGLWADANYSSLAAHGHTIVAELLERGATVIFRPHPLTRRSAALRAIAMEIEEILAADKARTGRQHLYGITAARQMTLFECFNKADAMICDVSGVASDFLYSGKPLALTDMVGDGPRFVETFPLAKAAYVLRDDASNLGEVFDRLLDTDPSESIRRSMKEYYLGDFPAESYGDAFIETARSELGPTGRPSAVAPAHAVERGG